MKSNLQTFIFDCHYILALKLNEITNTSGLGGKGGPYRLDAGHNVHQLSDEEKNSVPEEVILVSIFNDFS